MPTLSGDTAAIVAATLVQAEMARKGPRNQSTAVVHEEVTDAYEFYLELVTKVDFTKP